MIDIATTNPESMTDDEILTEYDSFPVTLDDLETYRKVQTRKAALAEVYNSRIPADPGGPAARSRRILT